MQFHVAGLVNLTGSLPGLLGDLAKTGGSLEDYTAAPEVSEMCTFLGHVTNPEEVLRNGALLIKPLREDNPWGRDILKAMAAGNPVLASGSFERFAETSVTGYLNLHDKNFNAVQVAQELSALVIDRNPLERMGLATQERVCLLCSGPDQAEMLMSVRDNALQKRNEMSTCPHGQVRRRY